MTAPGGGGADEIREQLAAALPESLGPVSLRRPSPPLIPDGRPEPRGYGDHLLDALLPTVQALIAKGAAAELRAAAEECDGRSDEEWTAYKHAAPSDPRRANPHSEGMADAYDNAVDYLRDRADALDDTP